MTDFSLFRVAVLGGAIAAFWMALGVAATHAEDPYRAAVADLKRAGGENTCVECFLEKYAPAEVPKAFAVSKDGAYGARWKRSLTMREVREAALASCRKKPTYKPENPCVVFMEDDRVVWRPEAN